MVEIVYVTTKILFTVSTSVLISSVLIGEDRNQIRSSHSSGESIKKPKSRIPLFIKTTFLTFLPVLVSLFVFDSIFTHPVVQGLSCSFISTWIVVHNKISEWSYTGTIGLLIDKAGLILSAVLLMKPDYSVYILSFLF